MNSVFVVPSRSSVRCAWRQFQRLQVTSASSYHTTSPGSGCSTDCHVVCHGVEGLLAARADQARRAYLAAQVLSAELQQVQDADRVADVGEPTHTQRSLRQAAQGRLQAVSRTLGLGPEGPVVGRQPELSPGRLGVQQLAEELVIAVPVTTMVNGHDQGGCGCRARRASDPGRGC
jgi:hypothetical protein